MYICITLFETSWVKTLQCLLHETVLTEFQCKSELYVIYFSLCLLLENVFH